VSRGPGRRPPRPADRMCRNGGGRRPRIEQAAAADDAGAPVTAMGTAVDDPHPASLVQWRWGWRWRLEFPWRPSPMRFRTLRPSPSRTQARRGIISRRQDATDGSPRTEPRSLEAGRVAGSSETRLGPCGTPAPVALEASADLHHTDGIWWQSHERATGPRSDDRQDPREDL
jgi:hypothetical protein